MALDELLNIIKFSDDDKVKISAIKELLSVTAEKKNNNENLPIVIFKGEVHD